MTAARRLVGMLALAASLGFAPAPAGAAEQRCGWLVNPTPANWWLTDRDATWIIMTQGANDGAEGMDLIPDISARQYVRTNGNYGYGCACMQVEVDRRAERIVRILSVRQLPLSRCQADRALRKP